MQSASTLGSSSVVDDSSVLAVAANHLEAVATVEVALAALVLALLPHIKLVDGAACSVLLYPHKQSHKCRSVTLHRLAESLDLNPVLDGFESLDRRSAINLVAHEHLAHSVAHLVGVEQYSVVNIAFFKELINIVIVLDSHLVLS